MLSTRLVSTRKIATTAVANRSLSTTTPVVPRIVDRRVDETGPGGRGSDAGLKVAVFGATGFLGRYVCCHLGTFVCANCFETILLLCTGPTTILWDESLCVVSLVCQTCITLFD